MIVTFFKKSFSTKYLTAEMCYTAIMCHNGTLCLNDHLAILAASPSLSFVHLPPPAGAREGEGGWGLYTRRRPQPETSGPVGDEKVVFREATVWNDSFNPVRYPDFVMNEYLTLKDARPECN